VIELETRLKATDEKANKSQAALLESRSSTASSARESLSLKKEIRDKEKELLELKDTVLQKEEQIVEIEDALARARAEAMDALSGHGATEAEIDGLKSRLKAVLEERESLETDLQKRLKSQRDEVEKLRGDLEKRVGRAESETKDANEQLVDAYARLKAEEGIRDRAKKAAEIAVALLSGEVEEGQRSEDKPALKAPRTSAARSGPPS
jgi:chromosome segregation ATPase